LRSWRNRVNPSWELLEGVSGDDDNNIVKDDIELASPKEEATPPVQTEKFLKDLFEQVNKAVIVLVEQKLAAATLKLDDSAKQQIRQLATDAAQQRVDELTPPRRIEVADATTGTIIAMGLQHEKFPTLLRAVQARDHRGFRLNIWLTGPTGSGKTSAGEAVSKALSLDFGSDGSLDADYKVLGFRDANGNIISTQFLKIYENGGIYIADEIDNWMPSALLSLNSALANGWIATPKGMIARHPDACVIACANTWGLGATGDYVGRTRLDAASLDRFQPKINWPYDEKMERAIAEQMDGTNGLLWNETVVAARQKAVAQGLKIIISPRATFNGISLLKQGFDWNEVIDMTIAAGISPEQKKAIGFFPSEARVAVARGMNNEELAWKRALPR
jgi:hypothetical protein